MFKKVTVPNERSRIYLAVALVDQGTLAIDSSIKRFGWTGDVSRYEQRYYTDKAPGSSLLGAALYGMTRLATAPDDWTIEELVNLMRTWLMIPLSLLGFLVLRRFLNRLGLSAESIDLVSLSWILAGPGFHYSTAYYGHQIVAVAMLAALYWLFVVQDSKGITARVLAGAATGLAGLTEYQSTVPCLMILLYVTVGDWRRPGRILAFLLGAAPFAMLFFAYNWLAFGGPFELSYDHLVSHAVQEQHRAGIGGVTFPQKEAIMGALFSFHRGLLFTSPLFALTPIGLLPMWRKNRKRLSVITVGIFCFYLLFIFSAIMWHGAWSFGLRLLVPALGCAAVPLAFAVDYLKKNAVLGGLIVGLVLFGLFYNQAVQAVFAELPDSVGNPLVDLIVPALERNLFSPNLLAKLTGDPASWTLVPLVALVGLTALFILWRRWSSITGAGRKLLSTIVSVIVVAAFLFKLFQAGSTWPDRKRERFLRLMEGWQRAEYGVARDVKRDRS